MKVSLIELYLSLEPEKQRKQFLTIREAAKYSGKCMRAIRQWHYEGKVDAVYIGKTILLYVDSLKKYLKEKDSRRRGI